VNPGARGLTYFNGRVNETLANQYRSGLLSTSKDELIHVAQKYLLPFADDSKKSSIVVVGQDSTLPTGSHWQVINLE
jgi:Zn-dependent M16 (insulinase) family peptidase